MLPIKIVDIVDLSLGVKSSSAAEAEQVLAVLRACSTPEAAKKAPIGFPMSRQKKLNAHKSH
jgi:hypothetical protein